MLMGMGSQFNFGQICAAVVVLGLMAFGFRLAVTAVIQDAISSETPLHKPEAAKPFAFSGCAFDFTMKEQQSYGMPGVQPGHCAYEPSSSR
jgi:hypothetical protein